MPPVEFLWSLLQPSTFVYALFVLSALLLLFRRYRAGRGLLVFTLIFAALPTLLPLKSLLGAPLEDRVPLTTLPDHVDGIIVLGGSVEASVSAARGQVALGESGERMMAGASLARRYPDATLVLTGLYADTLPDEFTSTWAPGRAFWGPPLSRQRVLWVPSQSTYEDALMSLDAAHPQRGQTWILVTSALHMPRALGVFQKLGWQVIPYPVDYLTTGENVWHVPANVDAAVAKLDVLENLVEFGRVVREWSALAVYRVLGRV